VSVFLFHVVIEIHVFPQDVRFRWLRLVVMRVVVRFFSQLLELDAGEGHDRYSVNNDE